MLKRVLLHILYFAAVAGAGFLILNAASGRILEKKASYSRYIINANDYGGNGYMMYCYENTPPDFEYDFSLKEYRPGMFSKIVVLGNRKVVPAKDGKCVVYHGERVEAKDRVKFVRRKGKGQRRIVFIGDSFTYGLGVQEGRAFSGLLGKRFAEERKKGEPGVDVVNMGQLGANFPELYSENFQAALKVHPDEVVYVWLLNDAPSKGLAMQDKMRLNDFANLENPYLEKKSGPALIRLVSGIILERRVAALTTEWYRKMYGPENAAGIRDMRSYLRKMKSEAEEQGVVFRVALFPVITGTAKDYPFRDANEAMIKILDEEGIPNIDLTGAVLVAPPDELWVHRLDHHPNTKAHKLAADALYDFVK